MSILEAVRQVNALKQPWAALIVHGRKTVEVRRWATKRRGQVLIHAARVADDRREAWAKVPPELLPAARLLGGVVGVGDLRACLAYRTLQAFAADQARHLNEPAWFQPPRLYGFEFTALRPVPFRPCPGNVRFFSLELPPEALG